ncbi:hypothetical protein PHYPO_G00102170 [Pangasianodon hypophthalmus]|uniref:Uncharacterized protein n=1 Tax=Pangasianodon hypophthalmus TaxID=310915 RepID=A0A5N5PWG6_PANHP|nr:hypothetical protein PHYPO_G00102170 [Pangasianodon hypophthalmus]
MLFRPSAVHLDAFSSFKGLPRRGGRRGGRTGRPAGKTVPSDRSHYGYGPRIVCGLVAGPDQSRHHCVKRVECEREPSAGAGRWRR